MLNKIQSKLGMPLTCLIVFGVTFVAPRVLYECFIFIRGIA